MLFPQRIYSQQHWIKDLQEKSLILPSSPEIHLTSLDQSLLCYLVFIFPQDFISSFRVEMASAATICQFSARQNRRAFQILTATYSLNITSEVSSLPVFWRQFIVKHIETIFHCWSPFCFQVNRKFLDQINFRLHQSEVKRQNSRLIKNLFMLSVRISSYGCTRKVWRARKMRKSCLLYTSPSPRDQRGSRMPSSA